MTTVSNNKVHDTHHSQHTDDWKQVILDCGIMPLIIVDDRGIIQYVSQRVSTILQLSSRTTKNKVLQILAGSDLFVQLRPLIDATLKQGNLHVQELELEERIYFTQVIPLRNKKRVIGASCTIDDITDRVHQERENALLYHIASTMSSDISVSELLDKILGQILNVMKNITSGTIMLINPQTYALKVEATTSRNVSTRSLNLKVGEGIAGWVAKTGQPLAIPHTLEEKRYTRRLQGEDDRSLLSVPLVTKGKILGVLNVTKVAGKYFTENQLQTYSIIASRIADALDSHRLQQFAVGRLELAQSLDSTPDMSLAFKEAIGKICQIMQVKRGAIFLWPNDKPILSRYVTHCHRNGNVGQVQIDVSSEQCRLELERMGLHYLRLSDWRRFGWVRSLIKQQGWPAAMAFPLINKGKMCGLLLLDNGDVQRNFDGEELNLAIDLSTQLAKSLENFHLLNQIADEKERLATIIHHSADGITAVDGEGKITLWNRAMTELTGYSIREAMGKDVNKFLVSKEGQLLHTFIKKHRDKNKDRNAGMFGEFEIQTKGGKNRWVAIHCSIVKDKERKSTRSILLLTDVSHYKELEQAKNEFISMATHELRTPLAAAKGYLSMIAEGDAGELNEKQHHFFSRAFQSTERLSGLVEDLLSAVRLEEKRLTFNLQTVNMTGLVRDLVMDFQRKAKDKDIRLFLEGKSHADETQVLCDPGRAKQVLGNLIDNAIKYTQNGGFVKIKITTGKNENRPILITSVEDNGVGIPAEQLDRLFTKFQRITNPLSDKAGGCGLGLFITKSLVEQQGGQIWTSSTEGKGSSFAFSLPVISATDKVKVK